MSMCCISSITLIQCVFNSYDVLEGQKLLFVTSQKSINPLTPNDAFWRHN